MALVARLASQPFEVTPSQFAKPESQVLIAQVPSAQNSVAFGRLQTVRQAPQLFTSDTIRVSQPLVMEVSQFAKPAAQVDEHTPLPHTLTVFGNDGQMFPQPPQLSGLFWRFTQLPVPAQNVVPDGQLEAHIPLEHTIPAPQRVPQLPQLALLLS